MRRLLWFSLVLFVAIELALVMLTGYYGWDTMEPWVYFLGVLLPLGMYGYFVYTTHEFSPRVFYEQRVAARLAKLALSHSSAEIHQQRTPPSVSAPPIMPSPHTPTPEPSEPPATFTNSIGMEFVLIRPGIFMMGTPTEQLGEIASGHKDHRDWIENETPQHQVEISQPFYLGKYPVTQRQWEMVMGDNPSNFKGNNLPVERVSWDNAQEFIKKLNEREGDSHYLLPTEAQWEYACRAGSTGLYSFGDEMSRLGEYAWYNENSDGKTHPVGEKKPNAWGLYDMHGNVWEWVQDWYDESYYQNSPNVDPQGPNAGARRVLRGGGWDGLARLARSALRGRDGSSSRSGSVGFRCAMSVPSK